MAQPVAPHGDGETQVTTVTRTCRRDLGAGWWAAMVVVTVALGVVGRGSSGFWSVFLWSIVGFVLGSLVALFVAGRLVPARSDDEGLDLLGGGDRAAHGSGTAGK
ncbi:hypothetical protein GCM10009740_11780 [Terrabacter terrae]|uniref:DUF2530 domain-containing protein n=1 Tax=Terrabacter terrae TaxID=318434 RepID=A0ABP5FCY6_9MICO